MCVVLGIVPLAALQGRASTKPSIKESSWEQNRNISDYGKYFFSFFSWGRKCSSSPMHKITRFYVKMHHFYKVLLTYFMSKTPFNSHFVSGFSKAVKLWSKSNTFGRKRKIFNKNYESLSFSWKYWGYFSKYINPKPTYSSTRGHENLRLSW